MSSVMLDTDGLLPYPPMVITTDGVSTTKGFAMTPFEPDAGYQVNSDDFDAESRVAKTYRLIGSGELAKHPLNLRIDTNTKKLKALGITLGDHEYHFRPDIWPMVRALRVQLDFPTGIRLESRPDNGLLRSGEIYFDRFYPLDTTALARPEGHMDWLDEGLQLALSSDAAALQQITGRYTLDRHMLRHLP